MSEVIESHHAGKVLGMLVGGILNMSQQSVLTVQKANCILGCIKRSVAGMSRWGFCPSTRSLWDPTWSAASSSWVLSPWKIWIFPRRKMEQVQRKTTNMIRGLENISYTNRLRELRFFSIEKGWLWGDVPGPSSSLRGLVKRRGTFLTDQYWKDEAEWF